MEDVKQIRKIQADLKYQTSRADTAEEQSAGWQKSAAQWKQLYLDEKARADGVQEKRVGETKAAATDLQTANNELGKANFALRQQAEADRQKIGELTFDVRKYKGERKWFFGAGAVTGGLVGGYVGRQTCNVVLPRFTVP